MMAFILDQTASIDIDTIARDFENSVLSWATGVIAISLLVKLTETWTQQWPNSMNLRCYNFFGETERKKS